jgi:hypothetical protein
VYPDDLHATIRVRLDGGSNILAGLILRRSDPDGGNNAYFCRWTINHLATSRCQWSG